MPPQQPLGIASFEPLEPAAADTSAPSLGIASFEPLEPIQVDRQFTSDVKVTGGTEPPAPLPPAQPISTYTRGRFTGLPGRDVTSATPEPLTEGAIQLARGAKQASGYYSQPTDDTLNGASDMIEGAFKMATPAAIAAAIINLPAAVLGFGLTAGASKAASKGTEVAGGSPAAQRFAGNVAAAVAALGVGSRIVDKVRADAQAVAAQARAFDAANPPEPVPAEPIPVGSGRTPATGGGNRLPPERPGLPPAPEPPTGPTGGPGAGGGTPPVSIDTAAALRDLAAADPNSAQAQTALAALQRAGLSIEQITAALSSLRGSAPPAAPVTSPVTPPPSAPPAPGGLAIAEYEPPPVVPSRPQSSPVGDDRTEPTTHEFASTQIQAPPAIATAVQQLGARIPDAELAEDGRETDAHITLKFGLHGNDPEQVRTLLADEPPITVRLGKTSIFPNGESNAGDVVKVDVDSPDLHRLNAKIADALPHTDTHPEYKPHLTIAYVKPGEGQKYAGDTSLEGQTFTVDRILFSGKHGERVEIPLGGNSRRPPAPVAEPPAPVDAQPFSTEAVHVTTKAGADGILANGYQLDKGNGLGGDHYGPGVYLADYASDSGGFWREQLATKNESGRVETRALRGHVQLHHALVVEDMKPAGGRNSDIYRPLDRRQDIIAKRLPWLVARFDALRATGLSANRALGQVVREAGYDGIVFERRAGQEIVAFNPSAVRWTHIDGQPIAPAAPAPPTFKPAEDAGRRRAGGDRVGREPLLLPKAQETDEWYRRSDKESTAAVPKGNSKKAKQAREVDAQSRKRNERMLELDRHYAQLLRDLDTSVEGIRALPDMDLRRAREAAWAMRRLSNWTWSGDEIDDRIRGEERRRHDAWEATAQPLEHVPTVKDKIFVTPGVLHEGKLDKRGFITIGHRRYVRNGGADKFFLEVVPASDADVARFQTTTARYDMWRRTGSGSLALHDAQPIADVIAAHDYEWEGDITRGDYSDTIVEWKGTKYHITDRLFFDAAQGRPESIADRRKRDGLDKETTDATDEGQQPQDDQSEHPGTDGDRPPAATSGGDRTGASAPVSTEYLTEAEIDDAANNDPSYDLAYFLTAGKEGRFADDTLEFETDAEAGKTLLAMLPRLPNRYILGLADAFEQLAEGTELSTFAGTLRGRVHRELLMRGGQGDLFQAPIPTTHAESRYAADNLADLTAATEKEQGERLYTIRALRSAIASTDPKGHATKLARLKDELRDLENIYEGTWSELADAGGDDYAQEVRARVESTPDNGVENTDGQPAGTTDSQPPPDSPVASGEAGATDATGPRSGRPARPRRGAGTRPRPARQAVGGTSEGDREPGTVPGPTGSVRGRRPVRTGTVADPALAPDLYRITDADQIGTGTPRERVARNLAAIRVIKQLGAEQRAATPEERAILVKYVGWGGLPRVFEHWKHDEGDDDRDNSYWYAQGQALQELLTPEEFARARNSTQNAHYTSPIVVRALWDAVRRLGVDSGSVLEPSAGIGHFVGLAPDDMRGLAFALVEKDSISAAIAAALYPGAYTQHSPFEQATLPDHHFALGIGNVPFGKIPITDPAWDGPPILKRRIHNYFFGKANVKIAPGGLLAFITSEGTLNSRDNKPVREYLASQADFLGAIRLPFAAFKTNANTEVITDIVFLRKRHAGEAPNHAGPWLDSVAVSYPNKDGEPIEQHVNEYFLAHPELVLGTPTSTGKQHGGDRYNVVPPGETDTQRVAHWNAHGAEQLAAAILHLPQNVIDLAPPAESLKDFENAQAPTGSRPFEFLIHEGQLAQNIDGRATRVQLSGMDEKRIRGLLPIRTLLRTLYDQMAADASDADIKQTQTALGKAYDAFVKTFGPISSEANWRAFREDPDLPLLLSLEDYDDETQRAKKTAIFTTRTVHAERRARKADTPEQALIITLGETSRIDLDRVGELLGQSPQQAAATLEDAGLIIDTPTGYQLPTVYLSGNVRVKLAEAEAAAKLDPRYQNAVDRLTPVIPADAPAHKINVRLGAPWVPAAYVQQFVNAIAEGAAHAWTVSYAPQTAAWAIDGSQNLASTYATADVSTKDLLLDALNDRRRTIKKKGADGITYVDRPATALARQRREDLHRAFAGWLLNGDQDRKVWAVRTYNDTFNAYVEPKVDGKFLSFPGMAQFWRDRIADHQRDAIARILLFGNTLLAHVVGAGKTLTMVAAGMEMKRLGLARKPMFVVPNHLISQVPSEFLQHYPNARILVATSDDLSAENRKRFTARVAAGAFDAVIMPYSAFVRVSMSAAAETAYQKEILDEIETAIIQAWADSKKQPGKGKLPPTVKKLENMRDRVQARLDKIANRPKDDMLDFEQLGVDALFVDEAHSFKNLYFPTRQQAAGIPSQNDVQRAADLYLKARYINRLSNYRNVVLATGTPVSNSMAEIFVMQKLLQERTLERAGVNQFDAWLAQFGVITSETELDPSGTGMSSRPRLKAFRNLVDLAQQFRQVADVKMIDDLPWLKARRPPLKGGEPQAILVPLSDLQRFKLDELKHRADNLDPRDRRSDNMPKITFEGRAAMLDMRLLDRRTPEDDGNKVSVVAEHVGRIYRQYAKVKGTQLVFLDQGVPGAELRAQRQRDEVDQQTGKKFKRPPTDEERHRGFELYADLKKKLVAQGIPADQIAFIHDIDKLPEKKQDAARKALFRKMKDGTLRVLIGSTGKMSTGMNVQDRLVALHNVEPAWKPSDIEQRNGRILRQGNLFAMKDSPLYDPAFEVQILNYVSRGSGQQFGFDAYMWQLNEAKAKIIADFFSGTLQRSAADTTLDLEQTVLTASQMKAVATGNPLILEHAKAQGEVARLEQVYEGWLHSRREAEYQIGWYRDSLKKLEANTVRSAKTAAALEKDSDTPDARTATIDGKVITGHTKIGEAILAIAKDETRETAKSPGEWHTYDAPKVLGTYRGLSLYLTGNGTDQPWLVLRHPDDKPPRYDGGTEDTTYATVRVHLLSADPDGPGGLNWRHPTMLMTSVNLDLAKLADAAGDSEYVRDLRNKIKTYEAVIGTPFDGEAALVAARDREQELAEQLGLKKQGKDVEQQNTDEIGDDDDSGADHAFPFEDAGDDSDDAAQFERDLQELRGERGTRRYMRRSDEDMRAWAATLLGIDPHADAAEVRTAYRAAVKANHPDANPTADPSRMADINVAGQWLLRHPTLADLEPRVGAAEDAPKLTSKALRDLYAQVASVLLMTRPEAPEYPALLARVTALKARIDAVYEWAKRHSNWEELDQPRWMAQSGHRWHENGDVVEDASFGPYWDYRLAVDIKALEQSRAFQRVAKAIRTVMDDFIAAFPPHIGQAIGARGFLFTRNAYGVHVDLHRYGGDRTHGVFINPFEPLLKFPTPDQAASLVAHAILHEITHEIVSGEGEQFTYTLGENEAIIGSTRYERGLRTLREAYGQRGLTGRRRLAPELADLLRGYAGAFGTGTDTDRSGGGGRNYVRRPADRDGAQDGVSAGARRDHADAAARTVTDDELRELARRHGTSVDVQRARAAAAGYTIVAEDDTHDAAMPLQTVPPIARAAETLRAAGKDITATLTAPTVSQAARLSSRHLRKRLGELMHTLAFANHALTDYRNAVERLTLDHDEILRLADILETGEGELPKGLQPWGTIRAHIFEYLKKQIADLGIEKQWREHYLGHVWDTQFKDGQSAKDRAMRLIGRRPLEGPKSFLKHRTIPTMRQGVARGLEPKTWNLVEIDLFKIEEMSKFILGRQALNDNRSLGTWTFVSALRKPPTGMVQIPDPIGAVWAPPQITVKEAFDALLTEGLESLIHELGIPYGRVAGNMPWLGRTNRETNEITMRVGAPEGALMHELGHALDNSYGLYRIIANAIKTPEFEGEKGALGELRELAKLRHAGGVPSPEFAKYVQKQAEQIANLVHAYLWAPDEAKRVAPRAYDAFDAFVMDHEELHPLMELQKMRSVVIAEREATYRLPGPILLGRYYAAPEVARIFKNYLTPGLGAHPVFQVLRIPSNALVQLKLSLSAFHALTVSIEGTSMAAGRMMRDLLHGKPLAAAKQAAKVLVEPIDAAARGHAIRHQYLTTLDPLTLAVDAATNLLIAGGGRVEQSREYTNRSMAKFADNLRRANEAYLRGMHGRALSESTQAAIRLLPAMIEAGAWPILQWFVPRVKAAAAVAEIQKDLEHLPGIPTEDTLLAIASKAVNLTDATLGEVIWDNYFLPRALMSAVQLVIMAPGWRGGSAVMLARGLTDPIRKAFPGQREDYRVRVPVSGGASGGGGGSAPPPTDGAATDADAEPPPQYTTVTVKEPYWSSHTTFLIGQVFVAILIAELYQHYLHHADHPRTVKDVAYPQTGKRLPNGEPERSRIPGYAGIFYDILRRPPQSIIEYLIGGEAPFAAMLPQLWRNETSFGEQITEPGDPWSAQLRDYLTFLKGQLAPISVSSYGRRAGTPAEKAESVLGLSPAPRRITDTPLEEYLHQVLPPAHKSREQAERATERRNLREAIRTTPAGGERPAVDTSHLSPGMVRQTAKQAFRSPLPTLVQQLSMTQALHAYTLASPEERAEIRAAVSKKLPTGLASTPPAERDALMQAYRKAMQLPVAPRLNAVGATP